MNKRKTLSLEHRQKIGEFSKNRIRTQEENTKNSISHHGAKHPRACLWTIESPNGKLYITKDIMALVRKYNLSYSILRHKGQTRDTRPILRGLSKGWVVLKYEDPKYLRDKWKN